jgi:hypothetical protein
MFQETGGSVKRRRPSLTRADSFFWRTTRSGSAGEFFA